MELGSDWGPERTWIPPLQAHPDGRNYFLDFNGGPLAAFDEIRGRGTLVVYGCQTWVQNSTQSNFSRGWIRASSLSADGSLGEPKLISPAEGGAVESLTLDHNRRGTAVATWVKTYETDAPGGARMEFQAAVHTPEGGWGSFQKLDEEAVRYRTSPPVSFVNGEGQVTLVWERSLSLWSARWAPGQGWTAPAPLNPDASLNQGLFTLLPTPEGKLLAIWAAYSPKLESTQLLGALQTQGGWGKVEVLANLKGTDQVPAAAFQGDGRLCLAYSEALKEDQHRLVVRRWSGMGLPLEEVLAEAPRISAPQLKVDASGRMLLAWQVSDPSTYRPELWAISGDAQGWRPAQALGSAESRQDGAYNLSLALAPDGRAWAAWMSAGRVWVSRWLPR